jgi:LacI family transcriptional regulator
VARSASVVDVAAHAGVSVGTVSNVLNRPERVSPSTRERVLRAIDELAFVRNEAARQLRAGHSRTVGLVVLDISNPFFTDVATGAEGVAVSQGMSVVLCNSNDDISREEHHLSMLKEQRAFGILITPVGNETAAIDEIRRRGIPVVLVDRAASGSQCSVSVNDRVGGQLATAHLIEQGHTHIGFVGGPVSLSQVSQRMAGARTAIKAAGLPDDALTIVETPRLDAAQGRATGEQLAAMSPRQRPTAVFCANDLLALGLLQDTVRRGGSVPGDLAIVGYDDIEFAVAVAVPLTSVRQPRSQLGKAAMEMLIEEARDGKAHGHRQIVFEPELIVRESSV